MPTDGGSGGGCGRDGAGPATPPMRESRDIPRGCWREVGKWKGWAGLVGESGFDTPTGRARPSSAAAPPWPAGVMAIRANARATVNRPRSLVSLGGLGGQGSAGMARRRGEWLKPFVQASSPYLFFDLNSRLLPTRAVGCPIRRPSCGGPNGEPPPPQALRGTHRRPPGGRHRGPDRSVFY